MNKADDELLGSSFVTSALAAALAKPNGIDPCIGQELKQAISLFYKSYYGQNVSEQRIVITSGVLFWNVLLTTLTNINDKILIADISDPCIKNIATHYHRGIKVLKTNFDTRFNITPEAIIENWEKSITAIVIESPSTQYGLVSYDIKKIAAISDKRKTKFIVDESFMPLVYNNKPITALEFSESIFSINSFSNFFGMPESNWQIGWLVAPTYYAKEIEEAVINLSLEPSILSQYAALKSFKPENLSFLENRCCDLRAKRDFLITELEKIGFQVIIVPDSGFYIFTDCHLLAENSHELASDILKEVKVSVGLGENYDAINSQLFFCFNLTSNNLNEGIERLKYFFKHRNQIDKTQ